MRAFLRKSAVLYLPFTIVFMLGMAICNCFALTSAQSLPYMLIPALCCAAGLLLEAVLRRVPTGVAYIAALLVGAAIGYGAVLLFLQGTAGRIVVCVCGGLFSLLTFRLACEDYDTYASPQRSLGSAIFMLACCIFMWVRTKTHSLYATEALSIMTQGFLVAILVLFWILRDRNLIRVVRSESGKAPQSVRRSNTAAVIITSVLLLALCFMKSLRNALSWVLAKLRAGVNYLISALVSTADPNSTASEGDFKIDGGGDSQLLSDSTTWQGWHILSYIVFGICALLMLYLLYRVLRKYIPALIARLRTWLKAMSGTLAPHAAYEDTTETSGSLKDMLSGSALREWMRQRFARKRRYSACKSDEERLRYIFAFTLKRAEESDTQAYARTPMELAREDRAQKLTGLCRDYTSVRYGDAPATAEMVRSAIQDAGAERALK